MPHCDREYPKACPQRPARAILGVRFQNVPRFIAFLRAVNVGGRTVRMDQLKGIFGSLGFSSVATFLASGNVVFDSPVGDTEELRRVIETGLRESLGFSVPAILRTASELQKVAEYEAFSKAKLETAAALNVAFLLSAPGEEAVSRLMRLSSEIDDFHVNRREVYWLCRVKQSDSSFSNAVLEKAIGGTSTLRTLSTVRKLAAKSLGSKEA